MSNEELDESLVLEALVKRPNGLNIDQLWSLGLYAERRHLSIVIGRLVQRVAIYLDSDMYKTVDATILPQKRTAAQQRLYEASQKRSSSKSVAPVAPVVKTTEPTKPVSKVEPVKTDAHYPSVGKGLRMGTYMRTNDPEASVLLLLWRYKDTWLSIDTVARYTGLERIKVAAFLYASQKLKMTEPVYIDKTGTHSKATYRWSGKFDYPFADKLPEDNIMLDAFTQRKAGLAVMQRNEKAHVGEAIPQRSTPLSPVVAVVESNYITVETAQKPE
jgi:hypothetical protein